MKAALAVTSRLFSALTLHLHQELCLDPPGSLALILIPGSAEGIYLINEDDGGFVLPGQLKEVFDKPVMKSQNVTTLIHPSPLHS